MKIEHLSYDTVRNNAFKLAWKIAASPFIPDVIYASLRGGAYLANAISEYFKILKKNESPVYYAAVTARSYSGIGSSGKVRVDGWTYDPAHLRQGDKVLLIDDIFDTGKTLNHLAGIILEQGVPREDLKIAVHDYKHFKDKTDMLPVRPDFWCRRFDLAEDDEGLWIQYLSHELDGLDSDALEKFYFSQDPELREALGYIGIRSQKR